MKEYNSNRATFGVKNILPSVTNHLYSYAVIISMPYRCDLPKL
jgi:hypothetical protein